MRFPALLEKVEAEIPGVKLIPRQDSLLMKTLFWCVRHILRIDRDFGDFSTTIGNRIYVAEEFYGEWTDRDRYRLLRHELMHLRQFRSWPFKFLNLPYLWTVNALIMGFCYLFVCPVFWTFRAKFEREGYTQSLLVDYELGFFENPYYLRNIIDHYVDIFAGPTYFYMWKSRPAVRTWLTKIVVDIKAGRIKNDRDRIDI